MKIKNKMRFILIFFLTLGLVATMSCPAIAKAIESPGQKELTYTLISSEELSSVHTILRKSLQTLLPEAKERYLDYQTPEAKKLIAELKISAIPYVIFDDSIVIADNFLHMAKNNMLDRQQGRYVIPGEMLKMAQVRLLGRKSQPNRLTLFVMSHCPYAKAAQTNLIDFVRTHNLDIDIKMRYIVRFDEFGLSSRGGQEEIKEDLRQIVLQRYYPDKFWDYLMLAQSKKPDAALKELGLSSKDVDAKKDAALKQLEQDAQECQALGIQHSPTFLWENVYLIPALEGLRQHPPFKMNKVQAQAQTSRASKNIVSPAANAAIPIEFFYSHSCRKCLKVKQGLLPQLKVKYGDKIAINYHNIAYTDELKLQMAMEKEYGILHGSIPQVFLPTVALSGEEAIKEGLADEIEQLLAKKKKISPKRVIFNENPLLERFTTFSPVVVALAGLIDGINPCAFATMVFFISFLAVNSYRRDRICYIGSAFILGVFLMYLGLGFGIFAAFKRLAVFAFFSQVLYYAIAGLALGLGIYSLCDYIKYKKTGQTKGCSLKLYNRLRQIVDNRRGFVILIAAAFVNGIIIALLESACTGQVYFPTIAFVLKVPSLQMRALWYLVLYNILFILPLVVIFLLAYKGITSEKVALFEQKHLGTVKLAYTCLFFGLAILLFML